MFAETGIAVELLLGLVGLTIVTGMLTGGLRLYALRHNVVDVPNDRSSHTVPTPRGGGLAIVAGMLVAVALLASRGGVSLVEAVAYLGAGALVAGVGFLDDHSPIVPRWRWRLASHFLAGAWALAWLGGLPPLDLLGVMVDLGWVGHIIAVVYLAWLLNLFNFMDGIDGIASVQTITVTMGAVVVYVVHGDAGLLWVIPTAMACATVGFLVWNWPPARIFLGDAGSGFLGMMLGVMSVTAAHADARLFWAWVILLAVFVVDATVTLLRRRWRGELFYEAHRNHAYQQCAIRCKAHLPVTVGVLVINVVWLTPLAVLVGVGQVPGVIGVVLAYVPLVLLAVRLGAGRPERSADVGSVLAGGDV